MTDDHIGRNGEHFPTGTIEIRITEAAKSAADRIIAKNEETRRTENL